MKRLRVGGAVFAIAASSVIACNALSGIGDLEASGLDDAGVDARINDLTDARTNGDGAVVPMDASNETSTPPTCMGGDVDGGADGGSEAGACTPAVPAGWTGPVLIYDKSNLPEGVTGCPASVPVGLEVGVGTPTSTFECPACKCGGPNGAACASTITMYGDTTCVDTSTTLVNTDAKVCTQNSTGLTLGAKFRHSVIANGSCSASLSGVPKTGAVSWTTTFLLCGSEALNATGCASPDERCLPPLVGAKRCIVSNTETVCPAPWANPTQIFGGVTDNRGCDPTSCACAPTGVTCSATYRTFNAATCPPPIGQAQVRPVDTCFTLNAGQSGEATSGPSAQGSCALSGAPTITGALAPATPATTCCLP